jgi:four helix bundle protein
MAVKSYRDLEVWQVSMDLAVACYAATKTFPKEEMFGLTSQIRRASTSIPANLAEGQGRGSTNEFIHFLGIARGSLMELETHLILSERIGHLSPSSSRKLLDQADRVSRMLAGLRKALERRRS